MTYTVKLRPKSITIEPSDKNKLFEPYPLVASILMRLAGLEPTVKLAIQVKEELENELQQEVGLELNLDNLNIPVINIDDNVITLGDTTNHLTDAMFLNIYNKIQNNIKVINIEGNLYQNTRALYKLVKLIKPLLNKNQKIKLNQTYKTDKISKNKLIKEIHEYIA